MALKVNINDHSFRHTHFTFSNSVLQESQWVIHLGHKLFCNNKLFNLDGIMALFYRQYNLFRQRFGGIASSVQADLFHKHCSSFYGCLLLPFSSCLKKLAVTWRKALRQVWRLSNRTHCAILRGLHSGLCDMHMFVGRWLKFVTNIVNNGSEIVQLIYKLAMDMPSTLLSRNTDYCLTFLNNDNFDAIMQPNVGTFVKMKCSACKTQMNSNTVIELCNARDRLSDCVLNQNEILFIIEDICSN